MSVTLPTNPPDAPVEKPVKGKFDPFHPEMPEIPGIHRGSSKVSREASVEGPREPEPGGVNRERLIQAGGIAVAVLLIGVVIFWWGGRRHGKGEALSSVSEVPEAAVPGPPLPNLNLAPQAASNVVATVDELSKPWATKKFTFVKPVTQENIPAMAVRLPGGELWAFSLQGPFGRCDLEYVSDLEKLASQYRYNASHPMVVSPCDRAVYDPLKVGSLGGNTWTRGEIVQGSGLRPPISIEVIVSGRSIIADYIE
jgi:hypothetical protein